MTPDFGRAVALQRALMADSLKTLILLNPVLAIGRMPWPGLQNVTALRRTTVSDEDTSGIGDNTAARERTLRAADLPLTAVAPNESAVEITDESVLRLLVEELSVDKRRIETGRIRVRRVTQERTEDVDYDIEHVEAEFERVPVGRFVDVRPVMRETEDTIVIPVIEEVVVVERRLMLKEEIHVRKTRRVERRSEQVTLRAQDAEVLRLPPRGSPVTS
jgi:uncharacterized protein (TIGR02271 family)